MSEPVDPITIEEIEKLFEDIPKEDPNAPIVMTDEQAGRWHDMGVATFGTRLIFTMESKERVLHALEADDYSQLTPYEIVALNILSRQQED